jgi:CBS domain-containing membrane protein
MPTPPVARKEQWLSSLLALVAMAVVASVSLSVTAPGQLALVASMAASAVLLYAVPHSPMAQPWALVMGHFVSGVVGLSVLPWTANLAIAATLAVFGSIFAMHVLRCLHPPGGATALTIVLLHFAGQSVGFDFLLMPLGINVLVLLFATLLLNNLGSGKRYPARPSAKPDPKDALSRFGIKAADLELAMREMNTVIDVSQADLETIYRKAVEHSTARRLGEIRARDVMVKDVVTVEYGTELEEIWRLMREKKVKGVPVLDRARRVVGMVTIVDFLKATDADGKGHFFEKLAQFIRRTVEVTSEKPEVAGQIMAAPAVTAREDVHVVSLMPLFVEHGIHHLPIVNDQGKLTGLVTQSDVMTAMTRAKIA